MIPPNHKFPITEPPNGPLIHCDAANERSLGHFSRLISPINFNIHLRWHFLPFFLLFRLFRRPAHLALPFYLLLRYYANTKADRLVISNRCLIVCMSRALNLTKRCLLQIVMPPTGVFFPPRLFHRLRAVWSLFLSLSVEGKHKDIDREAKGERKLGVRCDGRKKKLFHLDGRLVVPYFGAGLSSEQKIIDFFAWTQRLKEEEKKGLEEAASDICQVQPSSLSHKQTDLQQPLARSLRITCEMLRKVNG